MTIQPHYVTGWELMIYVVHVKGTQPGRRSVFFTAGFFFPAALFKAVNTLLLSLTHVDALGLQVQFAKIIEAKEMPRIFFGVHLTCGRARAS